MTRTTFSPKKLFAWLDALIEPQGATLAERVLRFIDPTLVVMTFLMLATDQIVLSFHIVFVLLALGSFFWKTVSFVMHALIWVTITSAILAFAVQRGQTQAEELIEIPLMLLILTTVFLIASRRARAQDQLEKQKTALLKADAALASTNQQLEKLVSELNSANQRNERRARQFEAIAQVARAAATNQTLEDLLALLVQVIGEKFEYYHAGIFLLDDNREYAELRAANSEGGRRALSRTHKLRVGQTGIVGLAAATGEPRIALGVEADAAVFNYPDLPGTHSEVALPLKVSGLVIGVLDIQSTEQNAFSQDDVEVLSTLADQVATAIQNARYFESTQELIEEAQRVTGAYLQDSWRSLKTQERLLGFVAADSIVKPADRPADVVMLSKVSKSDQPLIESGEKPSLTIPIKLAGNLVGVLNINLTEDHDWESDEIDIAKAVADRLSLALEAAALLETTQKRAEIERLTANITGKIGSTTQFDSILRTAAEELSRAFGGSEVVVQIQPMSTSQYTEQAAS